MPVGKKEDDLDFSDWLDLRLNPAVDGTAERFEVSRWISLENTEGINCYPYQRGDSSKPSETERILEIERPSAHFEIEG